VKSDIRVCTAWRDRHDRPVYALSEVCPVCGSETENSAPAPFDPTDAYGEYRRRLKRARRDGADENEGDGADEDEGDDRRPERD
jgi:H/ACA ribonucleoprotein complex subunit 3